jgi:hypothetical protein
MTRRRLLLLFGAIIAAFGGWWWSRRGGLDTAAARLVATIGPRDSAAIVGAAALRSLPAGSTAEHLVLAVAQALGLDPAALPAMAVAELGGALRARVRAEHLAGDTLSVAGWELSLTEARIYALAALAGES